jgi:TatD DNase family protein
VQFRRIDIHAHVNFESYDADREAVIRRAQESGTAFINVGTDIATSRSSVALAESNEGVYAIVGMHPVDNTQEIFDAAAYRELLNHPKTVGVGECGLDYFHADPMDASVIARQKEVFETQIALANEFGKPLMLHIRNSKTGAGGADANAGMGTGTGADAYKEAREILRANSKVKGNVHFFAGSIDDARSFLDLGYTLSFTGVITFARQYEELIEFAPLDMIQAETDSPFVAPMPYRGKRNEPTYVSEIIDKIARIKKLPLEDVEKALLTNARRVFGIEI